jgi:lysozyme family protein
LLVFDCAVNQGVGIARMLMQTALRVVVDGDLGPKTLAAAHASTVDTWAAFMTLRRHRYETNPNYARYGDGWGNRMFKVCLLSAGA